MNRGKIEDLTALRTGIGIRQIVVDCEAAHRVKNPPHLNEIIEIGAAGK